MPNGAAVSGVVGAAAAIAEAIKASGVIVAVEIDGFKSIVSRVDNPLIVAATSRFGRKKYHYLTSYKGLAFHARSAKPLEVTGDVELVTARRIWIPSMF